MAPTQAIRNIAAVNAFLAEEHAHGKAVVVTDAGWQYEVCLTQGEWKCQPVAADLFKVQLPAVTYLEGTEFDSSYARDETSWVSTL